MPAKLSVNKNELSASYAEVLNSIGLFMQYWGFKEVHGQVWTCIFLAEEPVDANHIIEHLKLSKAAISLAIKDLTEYKVIKEVEKTKPSTRKYVSNDDLAEVILNVLRFREKQMLNIVVQATRHLADTPQGQLANLQISKEKAKALYEMSAGAQGILEQILKQDNVDMSGMFSLLQLYR